MKKYIKTSLIILIIIVLVFVLIFFAGKSILPNIVGNTTIVSNQISTSTTNEILLNQKAPYFDLSDNNGNSIKLNDFINTPLIIVFWATWNQQSTDQISILDNYLQNKTAQNSLVKVVAINSMEDTSIADSFIRRGGYNVPFVLDSTGEVSNQYNIKSLPTTYFIDRDGIVREIYTGVLSGSMIVDKVENILK